MSEIALELRLFHDAWLWPEYKRALSAGPLPTAAIMTPSTSWSTLLLTLAVIASPGLAQSNVTLPLCADSCAVVVAAEVGCNVNDYSCCTNSAFISNVESCVDIDCTTTEQQEASSYFDSACAASSSGASSGTLLSVSSGSSNTATATTAKTSAVAVSLTSEKASTSTTSSSSGSGISGFNGSPESLATPKDLMKVFVAIVMGVVTMSQL
ncbi:hypothetical protein FB446DRAFT_736167 [Lentinula raphanica]|nr:hypothetical protein FB446DRAFT_736167 [Lentinula raphanica]